MDRKMVEVEALTTHRYAGRMLTPGVRYERDVGSADEGQKSGILRIKADPGPKKNKAEDPPKWREMSRGNLQKAASERGLDVEGSGASGYVTVDDLVAALEAAD
jgi:hypothetical protein